MKRRSKRTTEPDRLPVLVDISVFVGGIMAAAMSLALFLAVVLNASALLQAEVRSIEVIAATFGGIEIAGAVFAAAWVPVAICVAAFAIVIGGVAIVIWTTWVQQALAWINRQAALCPTLPWWQRANCWGAVAGAVALLSAALGLFFTAAAVVMINVIVVVLVFVG